MKATRLSRRRLIRRSFVLAAALTLVLAGLAPQPVLSLSSQNDTTQNLGGGIALWANTLEGSGGLAWSASSSVADGLVHANRNLTINGSRNSLEGGTEYGNRLRISGRNNVINPPAVKVTPEAYPITYNIADFRPGGASALAAGPLYFDGTSECELNGTWERHVSGTEIITGLHYAPCDVIISAADISGAFTIVSEGTIQVTAARITLGPAFSDDLLLFSNAEIDTAILIAGDDLALDGFVYAPLGGVQLSGANNDLRCGILADEIAVSGWGHVFTGDPACGNNPPAAVDDGYAADEDVTLVIPAPGVLENDTDAEGDPLSASLVSGVSNGSLTLNPDGSFTYQPDQNFYGEDSFTYTACDTGTPPSCASAIVTITVNPVNDPPAANAAGPYAGTAGNEVFLDGSGSTDLDGAIVAYEWQFGDGTAGNGATPVHTYATAGLYTVSLTVTDDGGLADTAITTAEISALPNTAPMAVDDAYATDEDVTLVVAASGVLGNDTDAEIDPLIAALVTDVMNGDLSLNSDGSFTYTPAPNFSGQDTFIYLANDGTADSNIAMVAITVNAVNDPPVADAGADQTVTVGGQVALDGSGSSDPVEGDPLTYLWAFLARPDGSTAALTGATSVAPTFTPDLPGDYTLELTVEDGNGGAGADSVTVTAGRIGMTLSLEDSLVGVGRTTNGVLTLDHPAPVGGILAQLTLDTAIAMVAPTDVPIAEGATEGVFVLTGVAVGTTTITGTSPVVETATAQVEVTDHLISIDNIPVIAPGESADLPISITKPAPPGGVTILLESLDPAIAVTEPTTFIPEGQYVPAANPQVTGVAPGTTQVRGAAPGLYAPDTRQVTVALHVTLSPAELDLPELWTLYLTAQLSAPAPAGGLTLELWLDQPLATAPANVFIPAGQTLSTPFGITGGTALGTTMLHAGGPGIIEGTTIIHVIETPDVYLRESDGSYSYYREPFVVGLNLQIATHVKFEVGLPGPVDVIVSAPAGSGVLFSLSPTQAGTEMLVVETGFTSGAASPSTRGFYVQGTILGNANGDNVPVTIEVYEAGTTTPVGYEQADMPSEVDVGPSGFDYLTAGILETTTFSPNQNVEVRSYALHDGELGTVYNRLRQQAVRGGHSATVDLTNSNPIVGTVVAPALFNSGEYLSYAEFDPLTAGTTILEIVQPAGFVAPTNGVLARTVNVDAPNLYLQNTSGTTISNENIGRDLQVERRVRLQVAPPAPGVDVTIEIVDPSVALISADPTAAGSASVTFPLVTGTNTPLIYIQGLALGQGTELRISAPGYDQWITTVQVVQAGFYIYAPSGNFSTTVNATNTTVRVRPACLDAQQKVSQVQQVRGGASFSVDVLSSDPPVGVITISPLIFSGDIDILNTGFDPVAVGTTTISITQPPGFTPPAGETSVVATVNP